MRALVLGGAGAVCKETTRDLAHYSDFDEIVVADRDPGALDAVLRPLGDPRLHALIFDANNYQAMLDLFPEFDIVINGLPYKYDYAVNKACVETGVNGLDLSSDDPQFDLHEQALEKEMLFVPGVGATPGITNLMVRRANEILDRLDEVDVFFAAFRCLAPAPGLLQTTLWEFNPDEQDRQQVYFKEGEWHPSPPMSGGIKVRFHEHIGEQTVYYVPHDESNTLPRSYPTLRRAAVRGCFPPHVMDIMGALTRSGMLSNRPVKIDGMEVTAIDVVGSLLMASNFSRENPVWGYGLVVEATGQRNGRRTMCRYRSHHPRAEEWGGESAYFKNVGIPLSVGAQLIAGGQATGRGVLPPELALPTGPFFDALAQRGITIEDTIIDTGILTN